MKHRALRAALRLQLAQKRAYQLKEAMQALLQVLEDEDASWHDLTFDVDCIGRRLSSALDAMGEVFSRDPATYAASVRRGPVAYQPPRRTR
jgi:phage terminase Nu1 subunit (DNA packaging protein)